MEGGHLLLQGGAEARKTCVGADTSRSAGRGDGKLEFMPESPPSSPRMRAEFWLGTEGRGTEGNRGVEAGRRIAEQCWGHS